MLTLMLGPSGGGKTARVMRLAGERAVRGEKSVIIVPEQYSHDAERQLCALCGAAVCMHAEILSFSRLCTRVLAECGGAAVKTLDAGGRILVMSRAAAEASPGLSPLRSVSRRAEFLEGLIHTCGELKNASVTPEMLLEAAEKRDGPFSAKLRDVALIMASYDAMIPDGMCDAASRLDLLTEKIEKSSVGVNQAVYIDGFSDFTAQELAVIDRLLKKGADVTVCLGCDGLHGEGAEFALPRRTAERLIRAAAEHRAPCDIVNVAGGARRKPEELEHLDLNLFSWEARPFEGECAAVRLYAAPSVYAECELAAAEALRFVRGGRRWRDIAVTARGWEKYSGTAESVFEKYGVPVYTAEKTDILQKPVMALALAALDAVCGGWDAKSVLRCLKTGLFGDTRESRDALENYVLKWNVRGAKMWRSGDWKMCPSGYSETMTDGEAEELKAVNAAREAAARPLGAFDDALRAAPGARGKCMALYDFLTDIGLENRLEEKTASLRGRGMLRLAEEYESLWEILVSALEQYARVLGDAKQSADEFSALLRLLLSQYEIGSIPVALDRVGMGDMVRMRRRGIKMLIVLGASDDALPSRGSAPGVLSENERAELKARGVDLGGTADDGFEREMNLIYTSLTLPDERLTVSYPADGGRQPSFIVTRLEQLFGISARMAGRESKAEALLPCFELAAAARALPDDALAASAEKYFEGTERAQTLAAIRTAAEAPRGRLAIDTAERLYGKSIGITASRAERFKACRFSYFMQYGLKAKPRRRAALDAPETGTFMHFVLENVAREAKRAGGFKSLSDDRLRELTGRFAAEYAERELNGLAEKSGRFRYLFGRLRRDAENIVLDMAGELRRSDFEPYDFELDFSNGGDMPPAAASDGDVSVTVGGKVDRVDGWVRDGKLYLKVVDYKTGKRSFSLSDVWYGLGIQMLIYLFVLQRHGNDRYGREIVPAGVLYAPARDLFVSAPRGASYEEIEKERAKKLVRSGLVLDVPEVVEAMERGGAMRYLPVKITKDGAFAGDSLVSAERLGKLAAHIDRTLLEIGREISGGGVEADPYYRGALDNACLYCDCFEACRFDEGGGDRKRFLTKLKPGEAWERIEGERENG